MHLLSQGFVRFSAAVVVMTFVYVKAGFALESDSAETLGSTITPLIEWADRDSAELAAMRHEVAAAKARAESAGALDDPMYRIEWLDIETDGPNTGATQYTLTQKFPFWGKRELQRDIARSGVALAEGQLRAAIVELHGNVKSRFAMYFYNRHAQRLTTEVLTLLKDLERIAQTRYSTGLAPQQDVIKAQTEQTALAMESLTLEAEFRQARVQLNALLNRPINAPLAEPAELRQPPGRLDAERFTERAQQINPQLVIQAAQVQVARDNERLVEKNRYPDFNVAISPIQRDDRLENWEVMVEANIPLRQQPRRHQEAEANELLLAALQRVQAIQAQVAGAIAEAVAGYEAARAQEQLLHSTLQPQAEATFSAALASYQTGKVDFATLLEAQRSIRTARMGLLKARVDVELRLVEIERLSGAAL